MKYVHFEPIGPLSNISQCGPQPNGLPPYIIPGSPMEIQWSIDNPDDWREVRKN